MPLLEQSEIQRIRQAVDIVDIISEYIPLTKKGKNYFCVCPFHDDHNPSMSVSKEKQYYTCFSCGASGNVFNFVANYEGISFIEALKKIASKAGISVSNLDKINTKKVTKYDHFYDMYKLSSKYYINNLNSELGKVAKHYLRNRFLSEETIKEFNVGLSLKKKDELTKLLLQKNYSEENLIDYGLSNEMDTIQDVFYNRIIFPIYDELNHIVGFSGRIYHDEDLPKYINTKETPIFKKGKILFNYYKAKEEIRIKKFVILVEGFFDVIRLHSEGIKNAVAGMGTSFTHEQALLIRKLSQNVYVCYDGDDAGINATEKTINELLKVGLKPKVIELDKCDPDEFLLEYGKDKFIQKINDAISYIDFKYKYYKKDINILDSKQISEYISKLLPYLDSEDEITKDLIINKLVTEFNISKNKLISKKKLASNKKEVIIDEAKKKLNKYEKAEQALLFYMLMDKEISKIYEKRSYYLPTASCRFLANEIIAYYKKNEKIEIADFISNLNEKNELINLTCEIQNLKLNDKINPNEIEDYLKVLKEYNIKNHIDRLKQDLEEATDVMEKAKILENIRKILEKE